MALSKNSQEDRILLIVEGEKTEVSILKRCGTLLGYGKLDIVCLKMNIYAFYRKLKEYGLQDTSTIDALKEIKKNDPEVLNLLAGNLPYIFLFMDFDVQDTAFSLEEKKAALNEMCNFFCNESDNGRLFINYPMSEAYKDIDRNNLYDFALRSISFSDSADYKAIVAKRCFEKRLGDFELSDVFFLTKCNVMKASFLSLGKYEMPDYNTFLSISDQSKILEKQFQSIAEKGLIYVLFSMAFFFISLYGKPQYEALNSEAG